MFLTFRWFPAVLAVLQVVRYLTFVGFAYWKAEHHEKIFDAGQFIRQDLARPFFQPYEFCGAWVTYSAFDSANLGLDFPAYAGATLLHSAITASPSCVDALLTPRGQVFVVVFVPFLWYLVGLGIRRIAQRRWCHQSQKRIARVFLFPSMISLPFGIATLLFTVLSLLSSDVSVSIRLAGLAFWSLLLAGWAAERLRVWPFARIDPQPSKPAPAP